MNMKSWIQSRVGAGLAALFLCVAATRTLAGQGAAPGPPSDEPGFKEFIARVQEYIKLQKTVESSLPALKPTDLPELIAAHQQALARTIREARPNAQAGNIFTPAACDALRRASLAALAGPQTTASSRAYATPGAPNPGIRLAVNGVYPDTQPVTALSPMLLAAFPPLPAEVAYGVVGRTLLLMDVKSRLVVDLALLILPPPS